jgi:hypothetical protein
VKRLLLLLGAALAAAVTGYLLVGLRQATVTPVRGTDLTWIRAEFGLNDEQFAAVCRLHDEYSGTCAEHCAHIIAARDQLESLTKAAAPASDITSAERRVVELEQVCNDATRAHLRRVAAVMPPDQGERFLRMVEPHLAQLPHDPAGRDGLER